VLDHCQWKTNLMINDSYHQGKPSLGLEAISHRLNYPPEIDEHGMLDTEESRQWDCDYT
jgi:hypothetical protein